MPSDSTKTYNVRLIRSFTLPQGHRRAGFSFTPGPTPQTIELTEEQYQLIKADPSLEFVDKKEVKAPQEDSISPVTNVRPESNVTNVAQV